MLDRWTARSTCRRRIQLYSTIPSRRLARQATARRWNLPRQHGACTRRMMHSSSLVDLTPDMNDGLELTGERFIPGAAGEIWYEHWHRYLFASPLVAGREVLDLACGEGYGSALLAHSARHVTGVDLASDVIAHARARYASQANLTFCEADCAALPFADASFDA